MYIIQVYMHTCTSMHIIQGCMHAYMSGCTPTTTHTVGVDLLDQSLQVGHPAGGEVAVLEEDPSSSVDGFLHHTLRNGTLREGTRNQ